MIPKGNDSIAWLLECEVRAIQNMPKGEQAKILAIIKSWRSEQAYNNLLERIENQTFEALPKDKQTKLYFPK